MSGRSVIIEKMAFGGSGFGREDGKACFVPFTAPGDHVNVKVVREKSSYVEGEILEFIERSQDRTQPACPQFTLCGGCNWQHLPYDMQLVQKQNIFTETLCRSGRIPPERIQQIIPAPEPYFYRSRLQLKVRFIEGKLHLGFYRSGSHFVIDASDCCAIADEALNRLIVPLRHLLLQLPHKDLIPQVDMATGDDLSAIVIVHFIGENSSVLARHLQAAACFPPGTGLYIQQGRKSTLQRVGGHHKLSYSIPDGLLPNMPQMRLSFSRGGFSQVNYQQNLQLIRLVCEWAELTGKERVLDLYCGNGNFSIPLSWQASYVRGLEAYEGSIDDARENATANNRTNTDFCCGDALFQLKRLATDGEKFDIVVLDPPRAGAAEVTELVPALNPGSIIYVSCDPATLARDMGKFKKHGYEVVRSCPVDMFPQTYHIESVTLLRRMSN